MFTLDHMFTLRLKYKFYFGDWLITYLIASVKFNLTIIILSVLVPTFYWKKKVVSSTNFCVGIFCKEKTFVENLLIMITNRVLDLRV